jgi:inosose dehydratase
MTNSRRALLRSALAAVPVCSQPLWAKANKPPRLLAQAFVFQQEAEKDKRSLAEAAGHIFRTISQAGYHGVEITDSFFSRGARQATIASLKENNLALPIVYTGLVLHREGGEVRQKALSQVAALADLVQPLGALAINTNPQPLRDGAAKTDEELARQAEGLNAVGTLLAGRGMKLLVHHHEPEMRNGAREWRHILKNTEPGKVSLCIDVDWVHQGRQDPLALLAEAGPRIGSLHLRNSRDRVWLEAFSAGDVDYPAVAAQLKKSHLTPYLVVELAYANETATSKPLGEDMRLSRVYAEKTFRVKA